MNYTFTSEDFKLVEKFIEIKNKGFYCDGKQLTDVYNRVLHKSVNPTNCGSCLRQRVNELEQALNSFKKQMEVSGLTASELTNEIKAIKDEIQPSKSVSEAQPSTMKEGENKAVKKAKNGTKAK